MTGTCERCGITSPYLIHAPDLHDITRTVLVCDHQRACEARVMLQQGASIQAAVDHAQPPPTPR